MPAGGEAIEAVSTAASKAAEEAATGTWLQELESGNLPRITAPGLTQGWFGPWESAPDEESSEILGGRQGVGCRLLLTPVAWKATPLVEVCFWLVVVMLLRLCVAQANASVYVC